MAKIVGHAADQETGAFSGLLKNPGHHGRGGGFTVRAGYSDDEFAAQVVFAQPPRTGGIFHSGIQNVFYGRVAAAQCITDDNQVGFGLKVLSRIALE